MLKRRSTPSHQQEGDRSPGYSTSDDELHVTSLAARVSPPRIRRKAARKEISTKNVERWEGAPGASPQQPDLPKGAAVEAREAQIKDNVAYFSAHFRSVLRAPPETSSSQISVEDFSALYRRHQHARGHHFVIHQHDHPVAGPHYDLRLQFSGSSSISFAIPYGMPGDPNSRRFTRSAIETRVHNISNHLIESASRESGSLLIWDTGHYEVLPSQRQERTTDDECSSPESDGKILAPDRTRHENEKLMAAFQSRKMRLRLHGTRLPHGYTIVMRLAPYSNLNETRPSLRRRHRARSRRRRGPSYPRNAPREDRNTSSSDADIESSSAPAPATSSAARRRAASAEAEDAQTRLTNAYPGASNTIGSVHQRQWFITLDRANSGFVHSSSSTEPSRESDAPKRKSPTWVRRWTRASSSDANRDSDTGRSRRGYTGFEAFYVRGPAVENSIVTGRTAADIMTDEGVTGWIGRRGWKPVIE